MSLLLSLRPAEIGSRSLPPASLYSCPQASPLSKHHVCPYCGLLIMTSEDQRQELKVPGIPDCIWVPSWWLSSHLGFGFILIWEPIGVIFTLVTQTQAPF